MTEKLDIRLLVNLTEDNSYSHYLKLEVNVVHLTAEGIRNFNSSYTRDPGYELADLAVTAQASEGFNEGFYGTSHEYRNVYGVTLVRAEAMVKCLRRIEKRMTASAAKFGSPIDCGSYLAHFADAVGTTHAYPFGFRSHDNARWQSWDDSGYSWSDVSQMRYRIEQYVSDWRKKHNLTAAD